MRIPKRRKRTTGHSSYPIGGLFAVMAVMVFGGLASDAVKGQRLFTWLPIPEWVPTSSISLFVLLMFFSSVFLLYKLRYQFQAVRSLSEHECTPYKCIILPVSSPYPELSVSFSGRTIMVDTVRLTGDDVKEDIERLATSASTQRWNWLHTMRAIQPHAESARRFYLLGSKDIKDEHGKTRKGSHHSLADMEKLLRHYVHKDAHIEAVGPVDFEDFGALMDVLRDIMADSKKKGFSEKDIIIDVTGGQKIPSIVGAVATLQNRLVFQYVQTNWPFRVKAYDVVIHNSALF
jgi:hypothetical protein